MNHSNLILHCGAAAVDREQVAKVVTPPFTKSWHPIPHMSFIERVESALEAARMRIVTAAHSLTKEGNRYFGLFQIANCQETTADYSYVLGLRNSHDKTFPAGLVVGSQVFVCDNLAFSGEIKIARKHTVFIERDLPSLTANAVGLLAESWTRQTDRINLYKSAELTDAQAHDFTIRALDVGACTVQQIPAIVGEWRKPRHPEFAEHKSAWRLFNAFTEIGKDTSLSTLPKRTISLHGLMDAQVGFAYKGAADLLAGTEDATAELAQAAN